jgi:hemerythrin
MGKDFFSWKDSYSVQIKEIDDQHKVLIQIINDLYKAFMDKEHTSKIDEIIGRMVDYASMHFTTEENYFEKFGYEESKDHIKEHEKFIEDVYNFRYDYKNNKTALTYEVLSFLQKWLANHIMVSDKKYSGLFQENGLEQY